MSSATATSVRLVSASVGGNGQCPAGQQRPAIGPARLAAPLTSGWQRPGNESLVARRRLNHQCLAGGSFDGGSDSEELDYSLTRELERVAQRDKYTKLASRLDLLYSVQEEVRGTPNSRVWAWEGLAGAGRRSAAGRRPPGLSQGAGGTCLA